MAPWWRRPLQRTRRRSPARLASAEHDRLAAAAAEPDLRDRERAALALEHADRDQPDAHHVARVRSEVAQRIVVEMERLRAGGDPEVRPTSRAWNSVISAWAQWEGEEMVSEIYLYFVPRLPLVLFFC